MLEYSVAWRSQHATVASALREALAVATDAALTEVGRVNGYFGDQPPKNLDELIERLQQQMAQAQSLLQSLSPEDREALGNVLKSTFESQKRVAVPEVMLSNALNVTRSLSFCLKFVWPARDNR
jgi:uncharacterized protein with von Willebrand factor type A (vWA) domain